MQIDWFESLLLLPSPPSPLNRMSCTDWRTDTWLFMIAYPINGWPYDRRRELHRSIPMIQWFEPAAEAAAVHQEKLKRNNIIMRSVIGQIDSSQFPRCYSRRIENIPNLTDLLFTELHINLNHIDESLVWQLCVVLLKMNLIGKCAMRFYGMIRNRAICAQTRWTWFVFRLFVE